MGRQKKIETIEDKKIGDDYIDVIKRQLKKDYGDIIVSPQSIIDRPHKIISVSPAFDIGLGGGVPQGSWFIMSGKAKCGKSSTLLRFASNAQAAGMDVYYFDIERRLKEMNIKAERKLNHDKFYVIPDPDLKKPLSSEQYLNVAKIVLQTHPGVMVIFDSLSALCEQRELEGNVGTETRGGGSKLVAQFVRQMNGVLRSQNSIFCGVVHLMADTSGKNHGYPIEKIASEMTYQLDVKIKHKSLTYLTVKDDRDIEKRIGQKVKWCVETSALGALPGQDIESYIRYGENIDEISEWIDIAISLGLIKENGAWYEDVKSETKFQGRESLRNGYIENANLLESLINDIKAMMGEAQ